MESQGLVTLVNEMSFGNDDNPLISSSRPGRGIPLSRLGRWERIAIIVWALLFLVIALRVVLSPARNSVFPIFATAGQRWLAGTNLYVAIEGLDYYRYSPLVAALLAPFSLLPDRLGGIVWRLANVGIYLGALGWWLRTACPVRLTRAQGAAVFLLILPLSGGSLNNGQSNLLVIGLLLATMTAVATQRWNLASACLALAGFFKLYPLAIGLLLAASYPRRLATRFVLAVVIGFLLPFFLQRPDYVLSQYENWMHHFQTYHRSAMPLRLQNEDVRLLCSQWLLPISAQTYVGIQLLAAAGIAGLCVAARRTAWPSLRQLALVLGLGCCWMLVFGPATESCTHVLLAPSLAIALLESRRSRRAPILRLTLLVSYVIMVAANLSCWFPNGAILHDLGVQSLAVLMILTVFVVQAGQRLRTEAWQESASRLMMGRVALDLPAPERYVPATNAPLAQAP